MTLFSGADKIIHEIALPNVYLIQIDATEHLHGMVANITAFEYKAFDLVLNRKDPLFGIRRSEIWIDQPFNRRRGLVEIKLIECSGGELKRWCCDSSRSPRAFRLARVALRSVRCSLQYRSYRPNSVCCRLSTQY